MKKMRKGKKMLLILLIAIVVIIATILIINTVKNLNKPVEPEFKDEIIPLPETVYSDMQVKNIQMQYLRDQDKTKLSMTIDNTSNRKAVDERLDAILIGPNENVLGTMETWIQELDVGDQYKMEVILKGDLTATTQIKLVEK